MAVTTVEGAGLASFHLAGLGSVNVLAGTKREGCCLLFVPSAVVNSVSFWVSDRLARWAVLASDPLVGVCSVTVVSTDRQARWSGLASVPLVRVGSVAVVAGR